MKIDLLRNRRNESSTSLEELRDQFKENYPQLLSINNGRLCNNVHQNFPAAVYFHHLLTTKYSPVIEQEQPDLPFHVQESASLIHNVPILIYDKNLKTHRAANVGKNVPKAELVLVKRGLGYVSGLVLKGPFRGLVMEIPGSYAVTKYWSKETLQQGMSAAYFLQNYPLHFTNKPYISMLYPISWPKNEYSPQTIEIASNAIDDLECRWQQFHCQYDSPRTVDFILDIFTQCRIDHDLQSDDFILDPVLNASYETR